MSVLRFVSCCQGPLYSKLRRGLVETVLSREWTNTNGDIVLPLTGAIVIVGVAAPAHVLSTSIVRSIVSFAFNFFKKHSTTMNVLLLSGAVGLAYGSVPIVPTIPMWTPNGTYPLPAVGLGKCRTYLLKYILVFMLLGGSHALLPVITRASLLSHLPTRICRNRLWMG